MEYIFTEENFESEVINSDIPVLVDFYADWCGPCKMMMPIVESLAEKYDGKVKVGKLNSDDNSAIAAKYNIMSIPNFLVFKDGNVVNNITGAVPAATLAKALDDTL
ncbi:MULTISPECIES: thioredoxin [unclassified Butyrivibrio]|uniref:thioredoxin n=1 Tax=unclassified Butyrivibrio TaxID=2639466 RepID=UPI0003FCE250|nr:MULTISPECIES: thioredoxin [unclassified Butyrivibrio]